MTKYICDLCGSEMKTCRPQVINTVERPEGDVQLIIHVKPIDKTNFDSYKEIDVCLACVKVLVNKAIPA
jgi:hypothetical protein